MDLSYFNARVRGFMGRLLRKEEYPALLKTEDLSRYIERLRSTAYGPYIEVASARSEAAGEVISLALRTSLADSFAALWKLSPPDARPLLKSILSAWEVYDLKAIVRGIARGVKREDIMDTLIPAGEFDQAALNLLLSSKDIHDLIKFLSTWESPYAAPLRAGLGPFVKNGSIMEMELNLDISVYGLLLAGPDKRPLDGRIMKEVPTLRIDLQNLTTLLKVAGEGYSKEGAAGFFIEGGVRIKKKDFIAFAGLKARDEVLKTLTEEIRDVDLKDALASADPDEPGLLEERFYEVMQRRLRRLSAIEPLSIALSAAFIYMKVREIKNLRLLAGAKSFGIPEDEIQRAMIYPL